MAARAVLDTIVVVSALAFSGGRTAWLREAWQSGAVRPLVSRAVVAELLRVLEYPKFGLDREEREILLGDYLPVCEVVQVAPKSRAFLELALAGKAGCLVTGDGDLLALVRKFPVPIVSPEQFRAALSTAAEPCAPGGYIAAAFAGKKHARRPSVRAR